MAEIIQFPGGKGPKKPEKEEKSNEEQAPEAPSQAVEKAEKLNLAKYTDMLLAMISLWPQVSHRTGTIQARQELVAAYTNEQIIMIVNQSTLADWQTKPVFFKCIVNEMQKRNIGDVNKFRPV